jgi:hypothetical protein
LHEGQKKRVLVRLRGLHRDGELAEMLEAQAAPKKPLPGGPPGERPDGKLPIPKLPGMPELPSESSLPEAVTQLFQAKKGFANQYFNQLNLTRVWDKFLGESDYSEMGGVWTLVGDLGAPGQVEIELSDKQATYRIGMDRAVVPLEGDVSEELQPPGSGGLLAALSLWRRLLLQGPAKFGDLHYLGTAPIYERGLPPPGDRSPVVQADVLGGAEWKVECKFYFSPKDGTLLAMEMFSSDELDPCEIYFSDYKQEAGLKIPRKIEVRYGDALFGVFQLSSVQLGAGRVAEAK